jgi:transposase
MTTIPQALLPGASFCELQNISEGKTSFDLKINSVAKESPCPVCGQHSNKVHSYYIRKMLDLPWTGYSIHIHWRVRKFYCKNEQCPRKVFCERLGECIDPHGRRTCRLNRHLNEIGFALGGNSGAYLAQFLGMPVSPSTMLRIVLASEEPEFSTPRVLGIDDWAFRKGHNYGTIMVDLEKRRPVDLLPDREAKTVEKWLKEHPGVEIISRDRASTYAAGSNSGAPEAIQVVDRWHLLKNLTEALKRMMDKRNQDSRKVAQQIADSHKEESQEEHSGDAVPPTDSEEGSEKSLSKYELQFQEVKKLQEQHLSKREIQRRTGMSRQTISKYFQYEVYPNRTIFDFPSKADPFGAYLRKRWEEGERSIKQLFEEIQPLGFTGSISSEFRFTEKSFLKEKSTQNQPTPPKPVVYSARKLSYLLSRKSEDLTEKDSEYLKLLFKYCPEAKLGNKLALEFKASMAKREGDKLDSWIEKAIESGSGVLKNFAEGLLQDYDAVKNAFTLEWSNGQASA